MREYSEVFKHYYDMEDSLVIVNMKQNHFYLSSPLSQGKLMDVSPGRDDRVVFIWKKSKEMNELYHQWCQRKPVEIK
ncbi:hypothetical protein D7X98_18900 [bacterium 1XD8-76]|nr:hypothetical protein D7X98_18900 [bacterium 1XD8-76]